MSKEYEFKDDGLTNEQRKTKMKEYRANLAGIQQDIKESKIPIIVLVEGFASSGKGSLINEFIKEMDPRFVSVFDLETELRERERYPFLYPYFKAIPENGKIRFMNCGWLEEITERSVNGVFSDEEFALRAQELNDFERQLRDNGYLVIKFFVDIDEKTQHKRQKKLRKDGDTAWRVSRLDLWQNSNYEDYREFYIKFMEMTSDINEWNIIDGSDSKIRSYQAFKILNERIEEALKKGKYEGLPFEKDFDFPMIPASLGDADLSKTITDKEYKEQLKKQQKKLRRLHNVIYLKKIPVILAFEGWDAAGKGGNIKRIAYPLDPRGFDVYPIASPEPSEKNRHYLWRFWNKIPRSGHIAIFDRTWYGRVMVERLEGFCSENDWKRAYNEINEFEQELTDDGVVLLKFWIHIDNETQLERFNLRQETPEKQWKITEEDWRNREKWPQYEEAISEMIARTSTNNAPWYIIESNDKKYARIKTLKIINKALEKAIDKADRK